MPNEQPLVFIDLTPEYKQNLRDLSKRLRNSNIQKGKSAGYRLIYQLESPTSILLLTIYAKSDREDIGTNEIRDILTGFDSQES
ncbi:hypothetical protein NIES2109_21800 [Nostoc sp. HK-01]|nr:hypothetical protein NIES2109_21800 [Nostoc sp. HK-01]